MGKKRMNTDFKDPSTRFSQAFTISRHITATDQARGNRFLTVVSAKNTDKVKYNDRLGQYYYRNRRASSLLQMISRPRYTV